MLRTISLKKIIIPVALILFLFSGCDMFRELLPAKLQDQRFNGSFSYYYHWEDVNGIEETTVYHSYTFDGTIKSHEYYSYESYDKYTGWSYSGDYPGDHFFFTHEISTNGSIYKEKSWDYGDEWNDVYEYSFSNDGQTLTFHDYYSYTGSDLILTKNN